MLRSDKFCEQIVGVEVLVLFINFSAEKRRLLCSVRWDGINGRFILSPAQWRCQSVLGGTTRSMFGTFGVSYRIVFVTYRLDGWHQFVVCHRA